MVAKGGRTTTSQLSPLLRLAAAGVFSLPPACPAAPGVAPSMLIHERVRWCPTSVGASEEAASQQGQGAKRNREHSQQGQGARRNREPAHPTRVLALAPHRAGEHLAQPAGTVQVHRAAVVHEVANDGEQGALVVASHRPPARPPRQSDDVDRGRACGFARQVGGRGGGQRTVLHDVTDQAVQWPPHRVYMLHFYLPLLIRSPSKITRSPMAAEYRAAASSRLSSSMQPCTSPITMVLGPRLAAPPLET